MKGDFEGDFYVHIPAQVSQSIVDYARDVAFKWSRYIFTHRVGKQQYGYCTHCNQEFKTSSFKHGETRNCPECKSECKIKASGKGRKGLVDQVYFTYYEKSVVNQQAIVATGIYAVRDYRFDYHEVETKFATQAMYIFELGNSRMMKRYAYWSNQQGICQVGGWERCRSEYSLFSQAATEFMHKDYSRDSIAEAVKGTPFSWSGWEAYDHEDMVKFFSLYSKYPSIEYLTKLGFEKLVLTKLEDGRTYSAINWRGKNLFKVLKLNKQELNEVKSQNIHVDFWFLRMLRMNRKEGWGFSLLELSSMADAYSYDYHLVRLKKMLEYGSMRDIVTYLSKQYEKNSKNFYARSSVLSTWEDYHKECAELEMDLTEKRIIYPGDLYKAHQSNIKKIKYKADQLLKQKVKERAEALQKYYFESGSLLIRPAESSEQLIKEGNALSHCVGGYCSRYATGLIDIFFIRKVENPDKPYFTVEVVDNKIIQCAGAKNCLPDGRVKAFIEEFKAKKLTAKKEKNEVKIAVPA